MKIGMQTLQASGISVNLNAAVPSHPTHTFSAVSLITLLFFTPTIIPKGVSLGWFLSFLILSLLQV